VTSVGLCSTSDVITFGQNWHYLYSSSGGGKDLSNDTRVIGSIEPEIYTKMLRNLSEKLGANFLRLHFATPWYKLPVSMMLSQKFLNWKRAQKKVNHCRKKGQNGNTKKSLKTRKAQILISAHA